MCVLSARPLRAVVLVGDVLEPGHGVADPVEVDVSGEPVGGGGVAELRVTTQGLEDSSWGWADWMRACSDAAQEASSRSRSADGEPGSAV